MEILSAFWEEGDERQTTDEDTLEEDAQIENQEDHGARTAAEAKRAAEKAAQKWKNLQILLQADAETLWSLLHPTTTQNDGEEEDVAFAPLTAVSAVGKYAEIIKAALNAAAQAGGQTDQGFYGKTPAQVIQVLGQRLKDAASAARKAADQQDEGFWDKTTAQVIQILGERNQAAWEAIRPAAKPNEESFYTYSDKSLADIIAMVVERYKYAQLVVGQTETENRKCREENQSLQLQISQMQEQLRGYQAETQEDQHSDGLLLQLEAMRADMAKLWEGKGDDLPSSIMTLRKKYSGSQN